MAHEWAWMWGGFPFASETGTSSANGTRARPISQVKKAEIRQMMADIDKEVAATVLFDEVYSLCWVMAGSADELKERL